MELPHVRRYRRGDADILYVQDQAGVTLGFAESASGKVTVQVPGAERRVHAALEAWAAGYPEDDLATHPPGRNLDKTVDAWDAEIAELERERAALDDVLADARHARASYVKGSAGEHTIGTALNKLYKHGWGIIHSIPLYDGNGDIDHLLIGPGGIWTVNSKQHAFNRVRINGDYMSIGRTRVDHIPQARREAASARKALSRAGADFPVNGCVILRTERPPQITTVSAPSDVVVLDARTAVKYFRDMPAMLRQEHVNQAFAVARRASTWDALG